MVGVVPSGGRVKLLKELSVAAGTVLLGAEFTNNDASTVYPEVVLIRDLSTGTGEGNVVATAANARETRPGVVAVSWTTPVQVVSGSRYFVGVEFPQDVRKEGPGVGPGIGALDVRDTTGSYVTTAAGEPVIPLRVDLDIRPLTGGTSKIGGSGSPGGEAAGRAAERFFLNAESPVHEEAPGSIAFGLDRSTEARLEIFDVAGRRVKNLLQGTLPAGVHRVVWDGQDESGIRVATGLYFVRLQTNLQVSTQKVVVVR